MGTKASNDEYVRLLAVPITRFSVMSITKARTNVSITLSILIRNEVFNNGKKEEKNQYLYKPGSVLENQCPIIYLSVLPFIVFRRTRASSPFMTMIYMNLQPPADTA